MRPLLTVLLPIVLPAALYFGYAAWLRRRAQALGQPVQDPQVPWSMLAGASAALLLLAGFATWLFATSKPVDHVYEPARLIDGKIVPGRTVPQSGTE